MTLAEATARAMWAVLGRHLDEFRAARAEHRAGNLSTEQWEPLKRDFYNALERRQHTVAQEVLLLMKPAPAAVCTDCQMAADTLIAGRWYCAGHAAAAPRLPVPAVGASA